MKIVYCINGTFNSGGMERVLANKANFLVEHGYEVCIVTSDQMDKPPFYPLDHRIQQIDLKINYQQNNDQSFINKIRHYPAKQRKHRNALEAVLMQIKPDITISMYGNDVSFLWKLKDHSRKFLEIHFSRYKRLLYQRKGLFRLADLWLTHLDYKLVKRYDKFVVLTSEDRADWGNLHNIEVIPNAVTPLHTSPSTLSIKRVTAIGRYDFQKGFDLLIYAWQKVAAKYPDWELFIYGDGALKAAYQAQIDDLNLRDKIKLMPATKDINQVYQNTTILALSSRYEGLPMVLLEAMSMGLPIVAFACKCGPRDLIEHGKNGFLVAPGNVDQLAENLQLVIAQESLRTSMSREALHKVKEFQPDFVMHKWIKLFESES